MNPDLNCHRIVRRPDDKKVRACDPVRVAEGSRIHLREDGDAPSENCPECHKPTCVKCAELILVGYVR